jgi:adenosylcobyric acid synthase
MRGLLVAGTASDVGKSVVVAGMCRWLARRGIKVAPFKAQNMALNSAVTPDGAEIGRAQVAQAAAARLPPEAAMNPILLKPGGEQTSQLVVMGQVVAELDARAYQAMKPRLRTVVLVALASLADRFEMVVCEGAGSPAELNLRANDLVNLGLARAAGLPVVVVGDIDRGGCSPACSGPWPCSIGPTRRWSLGS